MLTVLTPVFPTLRLSVLAMWVGARRPVDIFLGQLEPGAARRFAQRDAVDADLDLDDILDAVRGAGVEFLLLHPARGVGDIGRVAPDALAKALEAAAGAGAVDLGRLVARRLDRKSTRLNSRH